MTGYYGGMLGAGSFVPLLIAILVFGGIALVVSALVRRRRLGSTPGPADPLRVLAGRYARGEIDRAQYLQMRDDLQGPGR